MEHLEISEQSRHSLPVAQRTSPCLIDPLEDSPFFHDFLATDGYEIPRLDWDLLILWKVNQSNFGEALITPDQITSDNTISYKESRDKSRKHWLSNWSDLNIWESLSKTCIETNNSQNGFVGETCSNMATDMHSAIFHTYRLDWASIYKLQHLCRPSGITYWVLW